MAARLMRSAFFLRSTRNLIARNVFAEPQTVGLRHTNKWFSTQEEGKESAKQSEEQVSQDHTKTSDHNEAEGQPEKKLSYDELLAEYTKLKESYAAAEDEIKGLKNKLAYALADIDNVRKISRKDVANAREFALKDFGKDLLDVVDNCERALSIFPEECRTKGHQMSGIYTGLEMTANVMLRVFDKHGLARISVEPKQTVFDPNFHDALFQQPVEGLPAGIIFSLVKSGWTINGRVLRAAQVGVSAEAPDAEPPHQEEVPKEGNQ